MNSNCPHISHLFFADDAFFFGRTSLDEATMFDKLINRYCAESGQKINLNKSSLFFSNNVDPPLRASVFKLLRIRNNTRPEKYLGVRIELPRTKMPALPI